MLRELVTLAILYGQLMVGLPLNFYAFYRLFIKRTTASNSTISAPFKLLQQHLNIADLLVLLLFVPQEIALQYSKNVWFACSTLCRLSKFWNNLAFHLCSNIIVNVAVDRLISVYNMKSFGCSEHRLKPIRCTLGIAWALAVACAAPHLIVFNTVNRKIFLHLHVRFVSAIILTGLWDTSCKRGLVGLLN